MIFKNITFSGIWTSLLRIHLSGRHMHQFRGIDVWCFLEKSQTSMMINEKLFRIQIIPRSKPYLVTLKYKPFKPAFQPNLTRLQWVRITLTPVPRHVATVESIWETLNFIFVGNKFHFFLRAVIKQPYPEIVWHVWSQRANSIIWSKQGLRLWHHYKYT